MKPKFLLWLLLLPLLLLKSGAIPALAADNVRITFESNPPLSQVRPHGGPTGHIEPEELYVEVRDAQGKLIPNVQIDVDMIAPETNWFVTTDVPRVEGVKLLHYHFVSATGRQTFNYIFPIRGAYHVTIQTSPVTPGAFTPTTQTLDVNITEKETSLFAITLFMLILFSFGLVSAFILMRSHRAAQAAGGATQISARGSLVLTIGLIFVIGVWIAFLVHADVADDMETAENLAGAKLSETASASSAGAKLALSIQSPSAITPSQPAALTGSLTDASGAPIRNVHYEMSIVQIEDDKTVFATSTDSLDGAFVWNNDFWDGSEHNLKIVASPAAGSSTQFEPVTLEHVVEVTALAPPLRVKVLGLFYLSAVVALGLAAGLTLARRRALA